MQRVKRKSAKRESVHRAGRADGAVRLKRARVFGFNRGDLAAAVAVREVQPAVEAPLQAVGQVLLVALGETREELLAAVGPATAAKLTELHLAVDAMPDKYVAKDIAKAIADKDDLENLRVLLLRAEVANPELPKLLEDAGAIVDDVAVYQTVPETDDVNGAAAPLLADGGDSPGVVYADIDTGALARARGMIPSLGHDRPYSVEVS